MGETKATSQYDKLRAELTATPKSWLVTGAAGFIGSNLLETLLQLEQRVIGLDNFSTGYRKNLDEVRQRVGPGRWANFTLVEGDVTDAAICRCACDGVDYVLHQAALGSVPASLADPAGSHASNVSGFLNILLAARNSTGSAGAPNPVKRVVYASSSAVYGDDELLPKREDKIGNPLSPYAATKLMDEIYAGVFARAYGIESVGLRYFNVYGPRQDPEGAYAAVIPKWIAAMLRTEPIFINGDGETSRDFCFINDVVQANLLAATTPNPQALNQVFNVAQGRRTTLNELFTIVQDVLRRTSAGTGAAPAGPEQKPVYREFRAGDIRHSLADVSKARQLLGFAPNFGIGEGLGLAMDWYAANVK